MFSYFGITCGVKQAYVLLTNTNDYARMDRMELYEPYNDLGNEIVETQLNKTLRSAYIYFEKPDSYGPGRSERTESGYATIIMDFDENNNPIGLEVLW